MRAYLPAALGVVFAACLLVVFGGVLNFVLAAMQIAVVKRWFPVLMCASAAKWLPLVLQVVVAATLLIGVMTFQHVNVNRFSMHAVYRNRLTRAFLGSARNDRSRIRSPASIRGTTRRLSSLLHNGNSLFPVINITLNITAGNNTAWAERKAASFTATPLACGVGRTAASEAGPGRRSIRVAPSYRQLASPDWRHSRTIRRRRPSPAPVSAMR